MILKINHLPSRHITTRFLETIKPLGIKEDELGLDYFISEKDEVPGDWLPVKFRQNFVIVAISANQITRRLPLKRLIELCDKINKPIILLGTRKDSETASVVEDFFLQNDESGWEEGLKELNKRAIVYNACGKFNQGQMASIIKQAKYVFTYDNEFIPIASAFKKNTFIILGNTILSFGRYPYKTKFTVLENNKIACRPCSAVGFTNCPRGHFKCMNGIAFDFYLP